MIQAPQDRRAACLPPADGDTAGLPDSGPGTIFGPERSVMPRARGTDPLGTASPPDAGDTGETVEVIAGSDFE